VRDPDDVWARQDPALVPPAGAPPANTTTTTTTMMTTTTTRSNGESAGYETAPRVYDDRAGRDRRHRRFGDDGEGGDAETTANTDVGHDDEDGDDDDDDSRTDIVLPPTPASSAPGPFDGSYLVDASGLPPAGVFDESEDFLMPVDPRWLRDPIVAAAEFARPTLSIPQSPSPVSAGGASHARIKSIPAGVPSSSVRRAAVAAPTTTTAATPARPLAPAPARPDPGPARHRHPTPVVVNAPLPAVSGSDASVTLSTAAVTATSAPPPRLEARRSRPQGAGTRGGGRGAPHRPRASRDAHRSESRRRQQRGRKGGNDDEDEDENERGESGLVAAAGPLFNREGLVVPLSRRKRSWQVPVCIAGQVLWVAVSTTRRTLTVSTGDIGRARLQVPAADLVCCMPAKRAQLYCSDVVVPVREPAPDRSDPRARDRRSATSGSDEDDGDGRVAAVRVRRFDFYVGHGRFASRVGLLGGPNRRSFFAHLRVASDLFALRLDHPVPSAWREREASDGDDRRSGGSHRRTAAAGRADRSWLAVGAAAEPPEGAACCALVRAPGDGKGLIAVAASGVRVGRTRFDFLAPVPAIVHAEVPGMCMPRELYEAVVDQIARASLLFRDGACVERGRGALARAVERLPEIAVALQRDPHDASRGKVRLSVPPWAYTQWHRPRALEDGRGDDGGRLQLLLSPLEPPERDDDQCMILGAACLSRCTAAFSVERRCAWFWTEVDTDEERGSDEAQGRSDRGAEGSPAQRPGRRRERRDDTDDEAHHGSSSDGGGHPGRTGRASTRGNHDDDDDRPRHRRRRRDGDSRYDSRKESGRCGRRPRARRSHGRR
jgi:hypothetical protein